MGLLSVRSSDEKTIPPARQDVSRSGIREVRGYPEVCWAGRRNFRRPYRTLFGFGFGNPPVNWWAIFSRPSGALLQALVQTKKAGGGARAT